MFETQNLNLLINLGTYKPRYVLIRVFLISVVAVLLIFLAGAISKDLIMERSRGYPYLIAVLAMNSISEIDILVMRLFQRSARFRWNIYIQSLAILSISVLLTVFWLAIAKSIFPEQKILFSSVTQITLIIGLHILIIHLLMSIISNFAREWMKNQHEIEDLKQAKLQSDYNSLKDRLNPHFLFNNLSVLKSLIRYNPVDAEMFTQNFTDVYRYVLKSHEESTVSLKEELAFLKSYVALHKERLGEGLIVDIKIDQELLQKEIPPLALQLLIENAIKHNVVSKKAPLLIEIYSESKSILVKNNLNKKETTYSTSTGLKTLKAQYRLIANRQVNVVDDGTQFAVRLPLL